MTLSVDNLKLNLEQECFKPDLNILGPFTFSGKMEITSELEINLEEEHKKLLAHEHKKLLALEQSSFSQGLSYGKNKGPIGIRGYAGFTGMVGLRGTTGTYGTTGVRGITGFHGVTGYFGYTGTQGATGYPYGWISCSGYTGTGEAPRFVKRIFGEESVIETSDGFTVRTRVGKPRPRPGWVTRE